MTLSFTSKNVFPRISILNNLIWMNFNKLIPSTCNNGIIFISVTDERNFSILRIVSLKLICHYAWEQIKHLDMAKVVTHYQLSVFLVQLHACYIAVKNVFKNSNWLSGFCIPDFYWSFTSNIKFESYWWEKGTVDWVVIRWFRNEWLRIFEYFEYSRAAN